MFSLVSSTSSSSTLPTRRPVSTAESISPRTSSGAATQRTVTAAQTNSSDVSLMNLLRAAPFVTAPPTPQVSHIDFVANRPPAIAKGGDRVVAASRSDDARLEARRTRPSASGLVAAPTLDVRRRENDAAEAKKCSDLRDETILRYGSASEMNISTTANLDVPRNCTMFPPDSPVVHAPRHPSGRVTTRRLPSRIKPHVPQDYAAVEEQGDSSSCGATIEGTARPRTELPQAFRDIILWERLRRLDALTKPHLFDGSLSLVEELLLSFEALIEHGFCFRDGSVRPASLSDPSEDQCNNMGNSVSTNGSVARQLVQTLFAVVKAAIIVPPRSSPPASAALDSAIPGTAPPSPSSSIPTPAECDYIEGESWYANIQGKNFAVTHPTAKSYKAALQDCIAHVRALETTVAHRDAQLKAAHDVITKYQRAFRTVTAGGEEIALQRPGTHTTGVGGGAQKIVNTKRQSSGAPRGTSPSVDTDGDTESPTTADGGRRGTARPVDATDAAQAIVGGTHSVSDSVLLQPPPPLTTANSSSSPAGATLKPVVQAATEQVVAELLEQNGQLIHKVAEQSARIETFRVHVVYLERQVEELNHAVAVLVNSNFEVAQQYKAAIGVGTAVTSSNAGTPGSQTTQAATTPLYSPMLLDGRTAELVAYQSNLEIAKLLGVPLHTLMSQQSQQGAAGSNSSSVLLQLSHSQLPQQQQRVSRTGSQTAAGQTTLRSPPDSRKPSLVANTAGSRRSTFLDEGFAPTA